MGEKHIIEYKSKWDNAWLEWICGFANADGGTLYIGINDGGEIVGLQNAKNCWKISPIRSRTNSASIPMYASSPATEKMSSK